jgi:hypothetical protein
VQFAAADPTGPDLDDDIVGADLGFGLFAKLDPAGRGEH